MARRKNVSGKRALAGHRVLNVEKK